MTKSGRLRATVLAAAIIFTLAMPCNAADAQSLSEVIDAAAQYMTQAVRAPEVGSIGGEWAVIGLARSGYDIPQSYFDAYYRRAEIYIAERKGELHAVKYTDHSRLILSLTAIGYDPADVGGYDLTLALGDFEKTVWQGINGPIWALIALDSGGYDVPVNPSAAVQAARELYVGEILSRQLPDGGWNLAAGADGTIKKGEVSDPDITGMALAALANYREFPTAAEAIDRALDYLSEVQDISGGYSSRGIVNAESTSQVLTGISALGISADDPRFVKNTNTLIDFLLSLRNPDGSYKHSSSGSGDTQMATEQAFYALVAASRVAQGKTSLYDMSDIRRNQDGQPADDDAVGLVGKHGDVRAVPMTSQGRSFSDIRDHANRAAIEALASHGIINGVGADIFAPDAVMTRAQFATIAVQALGLSSDAKTPFADVGASDWFYEPVCAAYAYGIVSGTSRTAFNPSGTISRQEAAVMIARAAALCGMDTSRTSAEIRDTLSQFVDYRMAAEWAQSSLAFCYDEGIFDDSDIGLHPKTSIRRCEIAEAVYRMLIRAELL